MIRRPWVTVFLCMLGPLAPLPGAARRARARGPERVAGKTLRRARRMAQSADLPDAPASLHLPRLQQLHILLLRQGSIADASGLADLHRLLRRKRHAALCTRSLLWWLGFGA